jgi:hypothetical protein
MATLTSAPAIGYVNRASGKTITATSSATGYPVANLNNARMSSSWRSTALTATDLIADLATAQDVDVIGLLGYNGEDDADARFRTSESSNLATPEYDSGTIDAWDATTHAALLSDTPVYGRPSINFPSATVNSRYVGITVTDAGNADGYQKGSVFWAGPVWQPPSGMAWSSQPLHTFVGLPGVERVINGWEMVFNYLSEAQSRQLLSVLRNKLRSGRYLIVPRPLDDTTFLHEAIYATLVEDPVRRPQPTYPPTWSVELKFMEVED